MDNEPSWCSAINVVSETGAEAISSLFNIELLVLISDSDGETRTVTPLFISVEEEAEAESTVVVVVVTAENSLADTNEVALLVNT